MSKINELKVRNTTKKNLMRNSRQARQYDFLVKTGVSQDDVGFMSVLDTPVNNPLTNEQVKLGEYLTSLADQSKDLQEKFDKLNENYNSIRTEYETLNKEYSQILEKGIGSYLSMLINL